MRRRSGYAREAAGIAAAVIAAASAAADVQVSLTDVAGSAVQQVRAEAVLDAPVDALFAAIADVERYASFMPYVVESSIVARDGASLVNYQRLSFGIPLVASRHYAIRIGARRATDADARAVYRIDWALAPDVPLPAHADAIAVPLNVGFWSLQQVDGRPAATRVVYCVVSDPGGRLPAWIVNRVNAEAVPQLFEAVRAAANGRYANATRDTSLPPDASTARTDSCAPG